MPELKRAVFPGSFDPITIGHTEIVYRGLAVFDEIIVAIGNNSAKRYLFTLEQRLKMLELCFAAEPRVRVDYYNDLTIDFARRENALFLLRGLRNAADLGYEQPIELINKHMAPEIEVVHMLSSPATAAISSTIVREVMKYGGKFDGLIPDEILEVAGSYLEKINA
jgi:pantetheine-phosphate adenylyltransferase